MKEYRLSWEMPDSHQVDKTEQTYGPNCWSQITNWESLELSWHTVERTVTDDNPDKVTGILSQAAVLNGWAATRSQAIRNVRFESRAIEPGAWTLVSLPAEVPTP